MTYHKVIFQMREVRAQKKPVQSFGPEGIQTQHLPHTRQAPYHQATAPSEHMNLQSCIFTCMVSTNQTTSTHSVIVSFQSLQPKGPGPFKVRLCCRFYIFVLAFFHLQSIFRCLIQLLSFVIVKLQWWPGDLDVLISIAFYYSPLKSSYCLFISFSIVTGGGGVM